MKSITVFTLLIAVFLVSCGDQPRTQEFPKSPPPADPFNFDPVASADLIKVSLTYNYPNTSNLIPYPDCQSYSIPQTCAQTKLINVTKLDFLKTTYKSCNWTHPEEKTFIINCINCLTSSINCKGSAGYLTLVISPNDCSPIELTSQSSCYWDIPGN